jgi:hypothetical protein
LAVAVSLVGAVPASAQNVRVRHALFGLHDGTVGTTSLRTVHEGSVRLWDVGVRWDQIETRKHHYHWKQLDALVEAAQSAHAQATMVVAMTPRFYARTPTDPPRTVAPYRRFVRALMHRYRSFHGRRGIAAYQVWNEVNISTFWTGSTHQLAQLTRVLDQVRDSVDPKARVVAPPMVLRLPFELAGVYTYFHARIAGVPVWRYVDAAAFSSYPLQRYGRRLGGPEDSLSLIGQGRRELRSAGVPRSMPVWNTEINYGLPSGTWAGHLAPRISAARQAANVVRTYLLNAAAGVRRVFWYRYDWSRRYADTLLTSPRNSSHVTAAGRAYLLAQHWMHGTLLGRHGHRPCARDSAGTYTCVVRDRDGTRRIYWNPYRRATVRLAPNAHHRQDVLGRIRSTHPGATLHVTWRPVMVTR